MIHHHPAHAHHHRRFHRHPHCHLRAAHRPTVHPHHHHRRHAAQPSAAAQPPPRPIPAISPSDSAAAYCADAAPIQFASPSAQPAPATARSAVPPATPQLATMTPPPVPISYALVVRQPKHHPPPPARPGPLTACQSLGSQVWQQQHLAPTTIRPPGRTDAATRKNPQPRTIFGLRTALPTCD